MEIEKYLSQYMPTEATNKGNVEKLREIMDNDRRITCEDSTGSWNQLSHGGWLDQNLSHIQGCQLVCSTQLNPMGSSSMVDQVLMCLHLLGNIWGFKLKLGSTQDLVWLESK